MEQKSRCGLGKPWISGGFFLPNQTEVIGLVLLEKFEWKLLVTFFFLQPPFFASGFLLQMDFAIIDLKQF